MRAFAISAAAVLLLSACSSTDSQGEIVLFERSEALGNMHGYMGTGPAGSPTPVMKYTCTATDITGCTARGGADRDQILAAWKAGRLSVEAPNGTRTKVSPSAKVGN